MSELTNKRPSEMTLVDRHGDDEVGPFQIGHTHDEEGYVVINHTGLEISAQGTGTVLARPEDARKLAEMLIRHAAAVEPRGVI